MVVIKRLRMEGARQRFDSDTLLIGLRILQDAEMTRLRIAARRLGGRLRITRLRIADCGLRIVQRRGDYRNPITVGFCIAGTWHAQILSRERFEKKAIAGSAVRHWEPWAPVGILPAA